MHLLHVYLLHRFYYSIHRHKVRRAGSLVVVGCAGCCHSDTCRCVGDGGLSSQRPSISVLHFCVYFDKVSHFITSNCITELMIFMCVYAYMYVLYVIPQYHVFIVCVHKSHYHFYCVHNNVLQHVLCIWCYNVLLYFVRNDENKDDQSINPIDSSWFLLPVFLLVGRKSLNACYLNVLMIFYMKYSFKL